MQDRLLLATVLITLALGFYSVGVWAERIKRYLEPWHLAAFWMGLAFDSAGTYAMDQLGGGIDWTSIHTWTGAAAILLMAIHAGWATAVIRGKDEALRQTFHRYSLVVWLVWLVPYVGGLVAGAMGTRA